MHRTEAQLRTDLASGTRQLWDLEQELQGRAGTFPGWLQGAYEVNEDFEQSLGEVIAELCETFQEIKRRYGIEIARELYNEHPVILSSELPGAAQFLSLGGSAVGLRSWPASGSSCRRKISRKLKWHGPQRI